MGATVTVRRSLNRLEELGRALKGLRMKEGRVGVLAGATYPDGTPVSEVAAYLEWGWTQTVTPAQAGFFAAMGAGHIRPGTTLTLPQRPTFHDTFAAKSEEWATLGRRYLSKNLVQNPAMAIDKCLSLICLKAQQDVQDTIQSGGAAFGYEPRSPLTVFLYTRAAEVGGHTMAAPNQTQTDKPLYRSGIFMSSISYEIRSA